MSDRPHQLPTPEGEYFETGRFAGLSLVLGAIGFAALVLCAIGAAMQPLQFSYSWLFAFGYFFTLCAGCFLWTIIHHAVDAEWSVVVRRQLENISSLMVVLAILFIPVLLLRHQLYDWMTIPAGKDPVLDAQMGLAGAAIKHRIGEALDVPGGLQNRRMRQNRAVHPNHIVALMYHDAPPVVF